MSQPPVVTPRPAATICLLRSQWKEDSGCEVLMLQRHSKSGFAAGAWVFPGGVVEKADGSLASGRYTGLSPDEHTERFADPPETVLGFHVAAVRETFEEAGILLVEGRQNVTAAELDDARMRLGARDATAEQFVAFLDDHDLVLDLGALTYLSRWITPRVEGRRFDAAFFLAALPANQIARHDAVETTAKRWVRPSEALAAHAHGDFDMIHPTVKTLEWLASYESLTDAVNAAAAQATVPWILPHVKEQDDGQWQFIHPTDPHFPWDIYAEELRGPIR